MNLPRLILPFLILVALIGAPFGMGRMMDNGGSHGTMHEMHGVMAGMDHGSPQTHEQSAPHYMVCSACVATPFADAAPVQIALNADMPNWQIAKTLNGTRFLPPVPPPRA